MSPVAGSATYQGLSRKRILNPWLSRQQQSCFGAQCGYQMAQLLERFLRKRNKQNDLRKVEFALIDLSSRTGSRTGSQIEQLNCFLALLSKQ
jgi:hypothetical protein